MVRGDFVGVRDGNRDNLIHLAEIVGFNKDRTRVKVNLHIWPKDKVITVPRKDIVEVRASNYEIKVKEAYRV